jgi:hypothetical protein
MLVALTFSTNALYAIPKASFLSGIIFGLGHTPLLLMKRVPLKWGLLVVVVSIIGGTFFSYVILTYPFGRLWSISCHILWYYLISLFTGDSDGILP